MGIEPESLSAESSEEAICLERCLAALPPDLREFVETCFVDKRRPDLARELSVTKNTIRMRLYHAKRRLRACMDRCLQTGRTS